MSFNPKVVVAYVPSPHAGYLKFFRAHVGAILYVLGSDFIQQFPALVRNLPGVLPIESRRMILSLGIFSDVRILGFDNLEDVQKWSSSIVMPDEDVSRALAEKYFAGREVVFDGSWRLRWDWGSVQKSHRPEGERLVSANELDRVLMQKAFASADRSPDWWRQVGALLVRDGTVLLVAFNQHVPSEQSAYHYGDPRSNFEAGQRIDVSGAAHAEAGLIAEAAKRGIAMEGCDLYVTTFPCPSCAYSCSLTGIKRLFYTEGYSLVAGAETLEAKGVEIVRVDMTHPSS
jgi:dCMP deaminase